LNYEEKIVELELKYKQLNSKIADGESDKG
jgi:hypothetical protein